LQVSKEVHYKLFFGKWLILFFLDILTLEMRSSKIEAR